MDFLDLAKRRYSVRTYKETPVEEEKVARILEAARVSPSAANPQPTRLSSSITRALAGKAQPRQMSIARLSPSSSRTTRKAWKRPADGKSTVDIDASIATDHMMMEATSLGLGSVWICWFDPEVVTHEFGLPETLEPINILAIGYSDGPAKSPDRHVTERISVGELLVRH